MGKHVYPPFVLVCTLSTHREGNNERKLPGQGLEITDFLVEKKIPGPH